jgi:hypothetical protein
VTGSAADFFRRGSGAAQTRPVFTNRVDEVDLFELAVAEHEVWRASIDPLDQDVGRRNVVNFFGIGGVGKSTLLQHLSERADALDGEIACLTLDFEDTASYDLEQVLLRIRTAIGEHGSRCVARRRCISTPTATGPRGSTTAWRPTWRASTDSGCVRRIRSSESQSRIGLRCVRGGRVTAAIADSRESATGSAPSGSQIRRMRSTSRPGTRTQFTSRREHVTLT